MLEQFIRSRREAIIAVARTRVALRTLPEPSDAEIVHGIPRFLDQLCDALGRAESTSDVDHDEIRVTAGLYGRDQLELGLTIAQVVHDYGDICQAITRLVDEENVSVGAREFQTLNLCLDDAIAAAVSEFARARDRSTASAGTEQMGAFALALRNQLDTATVAFESVKNGRVPLGGSTMAALARSFDGLRLLLNQTLTEIWLDTGIEHIAAIRVAELLEETEVAALLLAQERGVHLSVGQVGADVVVQGDRQLLASALAHMLHNALQFTPRRGRVSVSAFVTEDRVAFEVADSCGGLPPGVGHGAPERHEPERSGSDEERGLAICRRAAVVHHGTLGIRDMPGKGCVVTLDLPRSNVSAQAVTILSDPSRPAPGG